MSLWLTPLLPSVKPSRDAFPLKFGHPLFLTFYISFLYVFIEPYSLSYTLQLIHLVHRYSPTHTRTKDPRTQGSTSVLWVSMSPVPDAVYLLVLSKQLLDEWS